MNFIKLYEKELSNQKTGFFILATKGNGLHGDVDFEKYEWNPKKNNQIKVGDLIIFRRPKKASETNKFYFFGAAKIGKIKTNIIRSTGVRGNLGILEKPYPFKSFLHPEDLTSYAWEWKLRGQSWLHFFARYGIDEIPRKDFLNLLSLSEGVDLIDDYQPAAAVIAMKQIKLGEYKVDDREGLVKIRAKQQMFSNTVKNIYKNSCALCSLAEKSFLIGSHIIPWSKNKNTRLDPSNGICLCTFHDKAFDKGYITIDNSYKVLITKKTNIDKTLKNQLELIRGIKINLPKKCRPNKDYLEYHRDNIFENF